MAKQPDLDDFLVPYFDDGKKKNHFSLDHFDPRAKPFSGGSKESDRARMSEIGLLLDNLQERLHAQRKRRMLLVLQGMDTSGKDGTIRAVFQQVDPLGLRIVPFKAPTPIELAHDFLWRVHLHTPAAGELTIFNRSHYEDLLVPTVQGELDAAGFEQRCRHIRQFEEMLVSSGATILKCMLHYSRTSSACVCRRALTIRSSTGNSTCRISKRVSSGTRISPRIATRWPRRRPNTRRGT